MRYNVVYLGYRTLLDDLLMAPLHTAVSRKQRHYITKSAASVLLSVAVCSSCTNTADKEMPDKSQHDSVLMNAM